MIALIKIHDIHAILHQVTRARVTENCVTLYNIIVPTLEITGLDESYLDDQLKHGDGKSDFGIAVRGIVNIITPSIYAHREYLE